jgi:hypothetical protein
MTDHIPVSDLFAILYVPEFRQKKSKKNFSTGIVDYIAPPVIFFLKM